MHQKIWKDGLNIAVIKIKILGKCYNAPETKENLADIINSIIDELIKSKFQLPAFKRLVRLARAARVVVSNGHYTTLVNELTDEQKTFIDTMIGLIKLEIVEEAQANEVFIWAKLKTEPKKPTHNNIKSYIAYIKQQLVGRRNVLGYI